MKYVAVLGAASVLAVVGPLASSYIREAIRPMEEHSSNTENGYPRALKEFCDQVASAIVAGNAEGALEMVAARSVIPENRFEAVKERSLELLSLATETHGGIHGYDLFLVEAVGKSMYRFSYLIRFKTFGARISLTFYGDEKEYIIMDYHLSQDFDGFFRRIDLNFPETLPGYAAGRFDTQYTAPPAYTKQILGDVGADPKHPEASSRKPKPNRHIVIPGVCGTGNAECSSEGRVVPEEPGDIQISVASDDRLQNGRQSSGMQRPASWSPPFPRLLTPNL